MNIMMYIQKIRTYGRINVSCPLHLVRRCIWIPHSWLNGVYTSLTGFQPRMILQEQKLTDGGTNARTVLLMHKDGQYYRTQAFVFYVAESPLNGYSLTSNKLANSYVFIFSTPFLFHPYRCSFFPFSFPSSLMVDGIDDGGLSRMKWEKSLTLAWRPAFAAAAAPGIAAKTKGNLFSFRLRIKS